MEVREYLAIRRAYNVIRQGCRVDMRLTFSEFAIGCKLSCAPKGLRISEIAAYQDCLRPTMTHRTKHMADLGLMVREQGTTDRRNVVCYLSEKGKEVIDELCAQTRSELVHQHTKRLTLNHVRRYVNVMGSFDVLARDLVLLALYANRNEHSSVASLVKLLGLLQPTVSISVANLERDEFVVRPEDKMGKTSRQLLLTDAGQKAAQSLYEHIKKLTPTRRSRKK